MKTSIQYLNNSHGKTLAVQLPISEWEKILHTLKTYEQILKIKSDLTVAFSEVEKMKRGKLKKQTLSEFLNEL